MKRSLLLFILITAAVTSWAQTIYTADNNPGATGGANIFTGATALLDAIAAATAGDIIHVVRSNVNYGTTTVDKQLSIFGIGLNPDTDGGQTSWVSTVIIDDPVASGSRISGLNITNQIILGGIAGALANILIENSRIRIIQHLTATTSLSNVIIRNNVIGSGYNPPTGTIKVSFFPGAIANIVIANNVFYYPISPFPLEEGIIQASNGTSVENNIFIGIGPSGPHNFAFINFYGNSVKNNIFHGIRPHAAGTFSSNSYENNITFNTGGYDAFSVVNSNTSSNNLEGQNPLLINVPQACCIDYSTFDPTLGVGSPAIGTGEGGTDMGVFGGGSPMSLEGTLIPTIQSITFPTTVVKGDSLAVQIKAKGN